MKQRPVTFHQPQQSRGDHPKSPLTALAALVILGGYGSSPAAPPGVSQADWRGAQEVLLEAGDRQYTEQELLLYALMTDGMDPELLRSWRTQSAERREAIRNTLIAQVEMDWLAGQIRPDAIDQRIEALATRILAAPAARWIWADTVVRRSVTIFPEDLIKTYRDNIALYQEPGFVTVRRLRVPYTGTLTVETQIAARQEALNIRQQAEREGGLAPILAARPNLLLDPPGRTVELRRDARDVDEELPEAAFSLGLNQISQPIRTPGGVILIEVVDRTEPTRVTLESIKPQLEEALERRFLPQQFDYLAARRSVAAYPSNNAHLYQFMPPETDIVRVRRFAVTKADFDHLYFDRVVIGRTIDRLFINDRVATILTNEVITQDLESNGLLYSPFYERAVSLARRKHASREHIRQTVTALEPTEVEVARFLDDNMDRLVPSVSRVVWRLDVALRNARNLTQAERDAMQILMRTYAATMISDATRQLDERRQLAAARGLLEPDKVVNNLPQPDDLRVRTRFTRVGTVTREDAQQVTGLPFDQLRLGSFTEPTSLEMGTVSSFFVSEENEAAIPPREVLLQNARRTLISERAVEGARRHVEELRAAGRLIFHPDLLDAPREAAWLRRTE